MHGTGKQFGFGMHGGLRERGGGDADGDAGIGIGICGMDGSVHEHNGNVRGDDDDGGIGDGNVHDHDVHVGDGAGIFDNDQHDARGKYSGRADAVEHDAWDGGIGMHVERAAILELFDHAERSDVDWEWDDAGGDCVDIVLPGERARSA